jgi:hypothetical protein
MAGVVVVGHAGFELPLKFGGQIVVAEQDTVLGRLVPALDFSLASADDKAHRGDTLSI